MKILITTDWYKPVINGVVTSVINLKSELEKAGHEVRVLTLSPDGHPRFEEDTYYLKSFKVKIYPQARATYNFHSEYIPEILEWKPDVVHSQCEWVSFYFAKYIAQKLDIPIVHTYHTIYEDYTHYLLGSNIIGGRAIGKKIVLFGSNHAVNATDYVITPTNKARNLLLSYGIENPIVTVPTGIDTGKYSKPVSASRRMELLARYGISPDKRVLVSVGRLALEKNADELIENMKLLLSSRSDTVLLIVGGGPYEDELKALSESLGLSGSVFFTGMVSPDEVPEYFRLGEVFVCASQSEAQGLTYIEALASGLPLLCKYDQCLDNVLIEGRNGYFFDNFKEFESGLSKLLDNTGDYEALCRYALLTAENYSKEMFGKRVAQVYSEAIANFCGHTVSQHLLNPMRVMPPLRRGIGKIIRANKLHVKKLVKNAADRSPYL